MDLGAIVGNLGLEGMLGGVDVNSLMGNLNMGLDLSAFGGGYVLEEGEDEGDEDDDEPPEEENGAADSEPEV